MADSSSGMHYTVSLALGMVSNLYGDLSPSDGVTDEMVLDLVAALRSVPWPQGTKINASKSEESSTNYSADDSTPPAFT
jgi:hypothetical protein